tara:strand:+ start:930 stop:1079 length:150 start_codon:yes stop_codon:yes gene_type:complete
MNKNVLGRPFYYELSAFLEEANLIFSFFKELWLKYISQIIYKTLKKKSN